MRLLPQLRNHIAMVWCLNGGIANFDDIGIMIENLCQNGREFVASIDNALFMHFDGNFHNKICLFIFSDLMVHKGYTNTSLH